MTVASSASWCSWARTKTSIRCGYGNAGASTSIEARKPALTATSRAPVDPPSRLADEQAMDGKSVAVGAQWKADQVDVDAGGPIVPRPQPVCRRRQQRQPQRRPDRRACGRRGAPSVSIPMSERDAGHAQGREERGREFPGADDHGGLDLGNGLLYGVHVPIGPDRPGASEPNSIRRRCLALFDVLRDRCHVAPPPTGAHISRAHHRWSHWTRHERWASSSTVDDCTRPGAMVPAGANAGRPGRARARG